MNNGQSIGIFDSGIGGLTVAKAIKKALPKESLIYFGDTAHLPYGDKSPELIRRYARGITKFLLQKECKAIVIACNTASAYAYQTVCELTEGKIPVINVIDPVVDYLSSNYSEGKIGVIGTKGTIKSRVYVKRINSSSPGLKAVSKATPLLAQMIEEGFYNNNISQAIINNYLNDTRFKNLDALVLGCTHYPLIKKEVRSYYNGNTEVVDSSETTALELKRILIEKKLLSERKRKGVDHYYISDYTASFKQTARRFFEEDIKIEEVRLWDK